MAFSDVTQMSRECHENVTGMSPNVTGCHSMSLNNTGSILQHVATCAMLPLHTCAVSSMLHAALLSLGTCAVW